MDSGALMVPDMQVPGLKYKDLVRSFMRHQVKMNARLLHTHLNGGIFSIQSGSVTEAITEKQVK